MAKNMFTDAQLDAALKEYEKGSSDSEVISLLRITRSTFDYMIKNDPRFQQVVEFGRDLAKAFWYKIGRENVTNNKFNTALWYANMKNRFGWSDRVTTEEQKSVSELSDDELHAQLAEYQAKMEKHDPKKLRAVK